MAVLLGVIVWLAPQPQPRLATAATETPAQLFTQAQAVVQQRCVLCHNAQLANKGVMLHTPELLQSHAQQVYQQAVVLKAMPMNNATQITEAERALLGRWFQAAQASQATTQSAPKSSSLRRCPRDGA